MRTLLLTFALVSVPVWGAPALPSAPAEKHLGKPNPQRMRISVTRDGISFKPARGAKESKVSTVKEWKVPSDDRAGKPVVSLGKAIDASMAEKPATPDPAIDGWAEVWLDKNAPLDMAATIWATLLPRLKQVAVGVKTPSGERTFEFLLTDDLSAADALLTVMVEGGQLELAADDGPVSRLKANATNIKKAATTFEKTKGKGRVERRAVLGKWECVDVPAENCWHGRVVITADDDATWGEILPIAVGAQTVVPDVAFTML